MHQYYCSVHNILISSILQYPFVKDSNSDGKESETKSHNTFFFGNLRWFAFYFAIGIGLAFLIPFPLSLFALIGIILIIDVIRVKYALRKFGRKLGLSEFFKSLSTGGLLNADRLDQSALRYYCMACGKENPNIECDYCGSKMKRAGWV